MADLGEETKVTEGVFGGVEVNNNTDTNTTNTSSTEENAGVFGGVNMEENNEKALPTKIGFWAKFKAFWLQEIDWNKEIVVELTPYQQKVEDEINEFLHQEITWKKVHDFLFQDVTFGKNNKD